MNRFLRLALLLSAPLAFATPPDDVTATKAAIEKDFLAPLTVKERKHSRMSRSRQPAMARRIRILATEPVKDASGRAFLTFAVDAKYGYDLMDEDVLIPSEKDPTQPQVAPRRTPAEVEESKWQKDAITGCRYVDTGEIFVNRSGTHYPAALLLGKKATKATQPVCTAGGAQVAAK